MIFKCMVCDIVMEEVSAEKEPGFFIKYEPAQGAPKFTLRWFYCPQCGNTKFVTEKAK